MKTFLLYYHARSLFRGSEWKPGITKWFENPEFEGCQCGNFDAILSVTNYEAVKDKLPKSLRPIQVL